MDDESWALANAVACGSLPDDFTSALVAVDDNNGDDFDEEDENSDDDSSDDENDKHAAAAAAAAGGRGVGGGGRSDGKSSAAKVSCLNMLLVLAMRPIKVYGPAFRRVAPDYESLLEQVPRRKDHGVCLLKLDGILVLRCLDESNKRSLLTTGPCCLGGLLLVLSSSPSNTPKAALRAATTTV